MKNIINRIGQTLKTQNQENKYQKNLSVLKNGNLKQQIVSVHKIAKIIDKNLKNKHEDAQTKIHEANKKIAQLLAYITTKQINKAQIIDEISKHINIHKEIKPQHLAGEIENVISKILTNHQKHAEMQKNEQKIQQEILKIVTKRLEVPKSFIHSKICYQLCEKNYDQHSKICKNSKCEHQEQIKQAYSQYLQSHMKVISETKIMPRHIGWQMQDIVLENTHILCPINIENAVIAGKFSLKNSVIHQKVNLKNSVFLNESNFKATQFLQNLDFSSNLYYQTCIFTQAVLYESSNFSHSNYYRTASYKNTLFVGTSNFTKTVFNENAEYQYSLFMQNTKYNDSIFMKNANFAYNHFAKISEYKNVIFNNIAYFENTKFMGIINFKNCTFNGPFVLEKSDFNSCLNLSFGNFNHTPQIANNSYVGSIDLSGSEQILPIFIRNIEELKIPSNLYAPYRKIIPKNTTIKNTSCR